MPDTVNYFNQQSNLTLEEVRKARPRQRTGAPSRTRSHYERILALLRERGPVGVLGSELYDAPNLYGRSPRNRISEMRKDGHIIDGKPRGASDWRYVLLRENESPTPRPPAKRAEQLSLTAPSPSQPVPLEMRETIQRVERDDFYEPVDWYERATGKPRPKVAPEDLYLRERRQ